MPFQRLLAAQFDGRQERSAPPAIPVRPAVIDRPLWYLSEAAGEWHRHETERGLADLTLADIRIVLCSIIEFADSDPPRRELPDSFPAGYLHWLRTARAAPRKSGGLPKNFSREAVAAFLNRQSRRKAPGKYRSEQRISFYWSHAVPFFRFLGLPLPELVNPRPGRRAAIGAGVCRPNTALPPALVPSRRTIRAWWQDCLASTCSAVRGQGCAGGSS